MVCAFLCAENLDIHFYTSLVPIKAVPTTLSDDAFSFHSGIVCPQSLFHIFLHSRICTIDITAFHSAGHQGSICVFYNLVSSSLCLFRVLFIKLFDAFQRLVSFGTFSKVCNYMTIFKTQIVPYDHSNIVKFKPLCGMDTAGLID